MPRFTSMWSRFKTLDPLLFLIPIVLITISVVVIYTLTVSSAGANTALKQATSGLLGLALMTIATFIDYRSLKAWALWLYLLSMASLILVEFIGFSSYGAVRWINLGFYQFQPGEFAKFTSIIAIAALVSQLGAQISWRRYFLSVLALIIPVVFVLLQPDLGTALVLTVSGTTILLIANLKQSQKIITMVGVALVASTIVLSFMNVRPFTNVLKDYQKDRLASFIEPTRDISGSGYNVAQSKIAVGSGGLTGKGLGFGSQSQLNFLPVAHADFIFAGIAEAWGIVGSCGIIALFGLLILRVLHAARIAKDQFGMLICVGIIGKLLFEVSINIGMNIGIMPVTGIPLPFVSYGGTTLLTNALLIGFAQSIVIRYKRLTF